MPAQVPPPTLVSVMQMLEQPEHRRALSREWRRAKGEHRQALQRERAYRGGQEGLHRQILTDIRRHLSSERRLYKEALAANRWLLTLVDALLARQKSRRLRTRK